MTRAMLSALRPEQWTKNAFCLAPLVFGKAWGDPASLRGALGITAAFCLLSSAVYLANDCLDRERDREHPVKRLRAVASGRLGVPAAVAAAVLLALGGLRLTGALAPDALLAGLAYLGVGLGYGVFLKHCVALDVLAVAGLFLLRILAGGQAAHVAPSSWLILCGSCLALFLAIGKRRQELMALGERAKEHREVLEHYSLGLLDQWMTAVTAVTLLSYFLYTVAPETEAKVGGGRLIWTVPFVIYGLLRYLWLSRSSGVVGDPAAALVRDPPLLVNCLAWAAACVALLGLHP